MNRVCTHLGAAILVASCAAAQTSGQSRGSTSTSESPAATAALRDAAGNAVGTATLRDTPHGVLLALDLTGVPAGPHALHLHAVGKCEGPRYESAGPHFSPEKSSHGLLNQAGPHAGDLPNVHVPADGRLQVEFMAPGLALRGSDGSLLDADGAAVVLHAKPDDYRTDPSGNAGDRIACGVLAVK